MTYRDETETLRAELDRVRAELATLKSEPREVEVIPYRDKCDELLPWVEASLTVLIGGFAAFVLAGVFAEWAGYRRVAIGLLALTGVDLATFVWLWIRSLPRVKVIR